jgi:hypothetical protein
MFQLYVGVNYIFYCLGVLYIVAKNLAHIVKIYLYFRGIQPSKYS